MESVPRNVAETVRQRMAALSEATQTVLAAAAVMGRHVQRSSLNALGERAGYTEGAVIARLEQACQARLLTEQGPHAYILFTHDLVREVVAGDLTSARRALLHRQVAELLEQGPFLRSRRPLAAGRRSTTWRPTAQVGEFT
jgi:predicted ATPase